MDADKKIQVFYDACTELKSTKFILAETKISAILKSIVNSPELVSIVSDALAGFNFSNEFNKIQVKNEMRRINIILPQDPQKLVAIVFSLLGEIDAHRVDFHDFIYTYFDAGGSPLIACFEKFVSTIVLPFRDTLCELAGYEVQENDFDDEEETEFDADNEAEDEEESSFSNPFDEDEEEEVEAEEDSGYEYEEENDGNEENYEYEEEAPDEREADVVDEFFNDVRVIINQIKDTVNNDNRIKEARLNELNITLDAAIMAIDYKNLKIFNALMISLNNLLHFVRSTKFYNNELQNRIASFYDEML